MDTIEVRRLLDPHRARLSSLGVERLELFGSCARGEAGKQGDLDLLVTFSGPTTLDAYMELRFFLQDLLGRKIDLATPRALPPRLRQRIAGDLRRVA